MKHKILFVVAHPDDESLWVGGILNFLSKREEVEVYVLCVTGKHDENRSKEFEQALEIAGIKNWYLADENIPTVGGIFLSDLDNSIINGLKELELKLSDIDLLITHPLYGDEHKHAQHSQLFLQMHHLCNGNHETITSNTMSKLGKAWIPFGFFSSVSIPNFSLTPIHSDMRRDKETHVINYCRCSGTWHKSGQSWLTAPQFFVQFRVDPAAKSKMLQCYQSINQEEHQRGYASWDNYVEGLYLMNNNGHEVIKSVYENLEVPGGEGLF